MFKLTFCIVYATGIWAVVELALRHLGRTQQARVLVYSLAIVSGAVVPWYVVKSVIDGLRGES